MSFPQITHELLERVAVVCDRVIEEDPDLLEVIGEILRDELSELSAASLGTAEAVSNLAFEFRVSTAREAA